VAALLIFLVLCGFRHISAETFALGSLRNDDWQLGRPTASPVLSVFRVFSPPNASSLPCCIDPPVTSSSSWERSETQFSGASFLSGGGSIFSRASHTSSLPLAFRHHLFRSGHRHHGAASPSPTDALADATHRCRASIRTLNGPLLGPVQVGVRSKTQVHHSCDEPGIVGGCHLTGGLLDQHFTRSHPNKAVDVVACQTFQITLGLAPSTHVCSLGLSTAIAPTRPLGFDGVFPGCGSPWPLGSRRWCHRCGHALAQRLIYFSTHPEAVQ
jgi:hypothetical protein